ncbi:alpha/beta hydrolase [Pseudomonas lopnurensis]|uniref:alpha/beta hydrolase n=1 Tax=Pseudomonas lopnurensis TaxID=1477517 RepID=UPI0028AB4C88|nr:alpha/beta hydrolase [Pseudomonas lopnurensis]
MALSLLLSACASLPSAEDRRQTASLLAQQHGWSALTLPTQPFSLNAFLARAPRPQDQLWIYIEGDGLAWMSASRPSSDPTPVNPVALQLALAQPEGSAAYLARPCQYDEAPQATCLTRYWTTARFAEDVIAASDAAVDELKARHGARELTLVGYSGGAAVAALVAARRQDVVRLVSVAGNLDHHAWTTHHRVTPLRDSLEPVAQLQALAPVEQWHLAGERDRVVPVALIANFAARQVEPERVHLLRLPDHDHGCCWAEDWPRLWREIAGR